VLRRNSSRSAPGLPVSLEGMFGLAVSVIIGVCLGFMFGVGCALAVMYSIYMGGYRAALGDMLRTDKPKRWDEELAKVEKMRPGHKV
jgi:hypothetical protein